MVVSTSTMFGCFWCLLILVVWRLWLCVCVCVCCVTMFLVDVSYGAMVTFDIKGGDSEKDGGEKHS
jgi:hypothetical protein